MDSSRRFYYDIVQLHLAWELKENWRQKLCKHTSVFPPSSAPYTYCTLRCLISIGTVSFYNFICFEVPSKAKQSKAQFQVFQNIDEESALWHSLWCRHWLMFFFRLSTQTAQQQRQQQKNFILKFELDNPASSLNGETDNHVYI